MTARRFTLYCLLLLLLSMLASTAAITYLYLHLPAIVASQGQAYLADYGVESIETTQPQLATGRSYLDRLTVSGAQDPYRFTATLEGVDIRYSPGSLARGELKTITVERLSLQLELLQDTTADDTATDISLTELLPTSIADLIPAESLTLSDMKLSLKINDQPPVVGRGSLNIQDQLSARMVVPWRGMDFVLVVSTGESPANIGITVQMVKDDMETVGLDTHSSISRNGLWQWQTTANIQARPLHEWLADPGVRSALPASLEALDGLTAGGALTIAGSLQHPDRIDPTTFAQALSARLQFNTDNAYIQFDNQAYRIQAACSGELVLGDEQASLSFADSGIYGSIATSRLGLDQDTPQTLGWGNSTPLSWRQEGPLTLTRTSDGDIDAEMTGGALRIGPKTTELTLDIAAMSLQVPAAPSASPQLDARFVLGGTFHDSDLPPLSGSVSLADDATIAAQQLGLSLAEPAGTVVMALSGSGQPLQGTGNYRFHAGIESVNSAAGQYLPLLPAQWLPDNLPLLRAGSAHLTSDITAKGWESSDTWQWRSQLDVKDLALGYDSFTVDGLSLDADWRGLRRWQTTAPVTLTVDKINAGFPLENLSATISLPQPTPPLEPSLRLEQLEMSLFDGRAYLAQAQDWDFASTGNSLVVEVEDLALAEIVALQQNRQVSADGRLSGRLPLTFSGDRVTIDSGHLNAAAPGGIIRYRPDEASEALAGNSPELGMALALLRNFHYEVLATEVALDKGGNLLLGLSLGGRNPEYEGGQAVNFNINLEQNIDPLLQSLRLSGSVVEQLEKKRR